VCICVCACVCVGRTRGASRNRDLQYSQSTAYLRSSPLCHDRQVARQVYSVQLQVSFGIEYDACDFQHSVRNQIWGRKAGSDARHHQRYLDRFVCVCARARASACHSVFCQMLVRIKDMLTCKIAKVSFPFNLDTGTM
jgi:hypothetical protein